MTTKDIDRIGEEVIRSFGCTPSFLNYNGYPASVCVSINDEVVHGIPTDKRIIREGDIVSLDAGVIYKGYHSDAARTHAVGEITQEAKDLIKVTEECFFEGIKYAKEGKTIEVKADSTILSIGYNPAPIAKKNGHVHIIGDASKVGNLRTVIWGAWDVCMKI
jgi:methionyl aminopeptidase